MPCLCALAFAHHKGNMGTFVTSAPTSIHLQNTLDPLECSKEQLCGLQVSKVCQPTQPTLLPRELHRGQLQGVGLLPRLKKTMQSNHWWVPMWLALCNFWVWRLSKYERIDWGVRTKENPNSWTLMSPYFGILHHPHGRTMGWCEQHWKPFYQGQEEELTWDLSGAQHFSKILLLLWLQKALQRQWNNALPGCWRPNGEGRMIFFPFWLLYCWGLICPPGSTWAHRASFSCRTK